MSRERRRKREISSLNYIISVFSSWKIKKGCVFILHHIARKVTKNLGLRIVKIFIEIFNIMGKNQKKINDDLCTYFLKLEYSTKINQFKTDHET